MIRFAIILSSLSLLFACSKSPEEAAAASDVQTSDGFRARGGVALTGQHVLCDMTLVENVPTAQILDGKGKGHNGQVQSRAKPLNLAIVALDKGGLSGAALGCSAELAVGARVTVQTFDMQGKASVSSGAVTGWRFHEGRAYLETDLATTADGAGAGVFGPDGKLVGVQAFKLGPKMTYVLPIEYATTGSKPIARKVLGAREACKSFAAKEAEAATHPDPLPAPMSFEAIAFEQAFSRTALVGILAMLDKKDAPAHDKPVSFKIEAVDNERGRKPIAEGTIDAKNVRWVASAETKEGAMREMAVFGPEWVKANVEPYDVGELRYRIPFASFCSKVSNQEVHIMTLKLADGRTSGEISFSDLADMCTGSEEGEGTALEKEWGMAQEAAAPAPAPAPAPHSKKKRGR